MNNQLLSNIEKHSGSFSKGQRAIAQFITHSYDKAAFMTAARLGQTVGVSESTVVRFAVEVGFDGYPELQKAMQEMIRSRLTSVQRINVAQEQIGAQDVLSSVLNADMDTIRATMEATSHDAFEAAVDAIVGTRRIYIVAARSSAPVAGVSWGTTST